MKFRMVKRASKEGMSQQLIKEHQYKKLVLDREIEREKESSNESERKQMIKQISIFKTVQFLEIFNAITREKTLAAVQWI